MVFSATITLNIFEYVWKTINLKITIYLYQKLLNCLNMTYTIALITNSNFENCNFLILPKISSIGKIKKTLIFVDSNKKSIALRILS